MAEYNCNKTISFFRPILFLNNNCCWILFSGKVILPNLCVDANESSLFNSSHFSQHLLMFTIQYDWSRVKASIMIRENLLITSIVVDVRQARNISCRVPNCHRRKLWFNRFDPAAGISPDWVMNFPFVRFINGRKRPSCISWLMASSLKHSTDDSASRGLSTSYVVLHEIEYGVWHKTMEYKD